MRFQKPIGNSFDLTNLLGLTLGLEIFFQMFTGMGNQFMLGIVQNLTENLDPFIRPSSQQ